MGALILLKGNQQDWSQAVNIEHILIAFYFRRKFGYLHLIWHGLGFLYSLNNSFLYLTVIFISKFKIQNSVKLMSSRDIKDYVPTVYGVWFLYFWIIINQSSKDRLSWKQFLQGAIIL